MSRQKDHSQLETRRQILDAAARHFGTVGFRGSSIQTIAKLAKVNPVTIYRLFGNKKKLIQSVITERIANTTALQMVEILSAADETKPDAAIRLLLRAGTELFMEDPYVLRLFLFAALENNTVAKKAASARLEVFLTQMTAFFTLHQSNGEMRPDTSAFGLAKVFGSICIYHHMVYELFALRPENRNHDVQEYSRIFLEGALPK